MARQQRRGDTPTPGDRTLERWRKEQQDKDRAEAEQKEQRRRRTELERAFIAVRGGMPDTGNDRQDALAFARLLGQLGRLLQENPDPVPRPPDRISAEEGSPKAYALDVLREATVGNEATAADMLLGSWQASRPKHADVLYWLTAGLEKEVMAKDGPAPGRATPAPTSGGGGGEPDSTDPASFLAHAEYCLTTWAELERRRGTLSAGELDALDRLRPLLPAVLDRAGELLERLDVDSAPLQRVALSHDPRQVADALVAIRRASARSTSRPAHPTADYCLMPGFRVRWEGATNLAPQLWHVLDYLLRRDHYPFPVAALQEAVWADTDILPKTVNNTISRLNAALVPIRFPWEWRVQAAHVHRDG
jgi:hypothetical protein